MSQACTILAGLFVSVSLGNAEVPHQYDLVVYGGTSSGVIAAVQATKMGKTAIIVCPDKHLGGLSSGGLGWTDSGKKEAVGGLSQEFYHRVWKHYQRPDAWRWQDQKEFGNKHQSPAGANGAGPALWVFEPHVAETVFEDFVREHKISVHRDEWLDRENGVAKEGERITSIKMLSGNEYRGKMFIDATYEGDLMAGARVDFHVGREANSVYDETWNGIQTGVLHHGHWFKKPIDPYVIAGDPDSGLLPRISAEPPGKKDEGDHRVQAYCFRMCLTNAPENCIPFPKPDGYDPRQYELMLRVFDSGWRQTFGKFDHIQNFKTDTNNHGPFSTDNIGCNYDYPNGSYERRREIISEHESYQKGLMYFLANDPRVPDEVRNKMATWGLPKDEFKDNGGWPHQIYVREARRMVGKYVMTEHDCFDRKETPESVGMGSYTLDSHNVQRYVKPDGFVQNEGDIGVGVPPYEIAYGALTPRKQQCENLLVTVCVSSSHIAFGSIRMEPVFMILGQSAATAACMSIEADLAVQDLAYEQLKKRLLADGQILEMEKSVTLSASKLKGIVIDDRKAKQAGKWEASASKQPFVDGGYLHDGNKDKGKKSVSYSAALEAGRYEVRVVYSADGNRATNVPVTVHHKGGETTVKINQRMPPRLDNVSVSIGTFEFAAQAEIVISNEDTDGYVIADAVQLVPEE